VFKVGDRIRKVFGGSNIGATAVVTGISIGSPDGFEVEIRSDVPMSFLMESGWTFHQSAGLKSWINPKEWSIDRYDGNDPSHWIECCWTPRKGFVKK
jgi:hypothetical protein